MLNHQEQSGNRLQRLLFAVKATTIAHVDAMVQSIAVTGDRNEGLESGEVTGPRLADDIRLVLEVDDADEGDSSESATSESAQLRQSPRSILTNSLRAHTTRLVSFKC